MAYMGFRNLKADLAKKGVNDPGAVAASVGRKKYGKEAFQHAAATGTSLKGKGPIGHGRGKTKKADKIEKKFPDSKFPPRK